ncbi:MAG TPA: M56 family metallopeptidase, partial [Geothrix sp.]|nr:M56 family metallopeptidase [Geothrix sp.]
MNDLASIPLLQAIGWALLHSLWQGALLALLAAMALWLARRRSAEFRYTIASTTLGLLVLAFAGTLAWISTGGDPLSTTNDVLITPMVEGGGLGSWMFQLHAVLGPWIPWLFLAWVLGFSFRLVLVGHAMAWLYGPCLGSLQPPPAEWLTRFEALRVRARVRIPVRLGLSTRVDSLVVLGWLKPVVLVPAAAFLALSPEALEALLAHELAHVRRGDFLANLVQTFAEALLFYHPAVWWLSRRIRQEREHCCDDAAVQACGDPILYASALVGLEELRSQSILIPDLAPAASGGHLMSRIQRLLRPHPSHVAAAPLAIFIPVLLLVA